jgi:hypothetical protein
MMFATFFSLVFRGFEVIDVRLLLYCLGKYLYIVL